jgi:hypothetical protein
MQHSTYGNSSAEKDGKKTKLMAGGKGIDRLAWSKAVLHTRHRVEYKEGKEIVLSLFFADTDRVALSKSPTSSISS